jgi:hypothetical protein
MIMKRISNTRQIADKEVARVFASYPVKLRTRLLQLRKLILETAAELAEVGVLEETLKWNEPAYLTTQSRSGSTIRINRVNGSDTKYAMYFNCKTTLVDSFRSLFPTTFRYQGDRAIEFDLTDKVPVAELKMCIAMTLTYHRKKQ